MKSLIIGFFSGIVGAVIVIVIISLWMKRQERLDKEYFEKFIKRELIKRAQPRPGRFHDN